MISYVNILHIIPVLISLFFGVFLLTFKSNNNKANKILGVFMLLLSLLLFSNFFYYIRLYSVVVYVRYYFVMPIVLCVAPALLLYIEALTVEGFEFTKKKFRHFYPAILILILNLLLYGSLSNDDKYKFVVNGHLLDFTKESFHIRAVYAIKNFSDIVYYVQIVVYIILMIILFKRHKNNIEKYFSYKEKISLNWLKIFIITFVFLSILDIFEDIFSLQLREYWEIIDAVEIILYVYFLGYFGIKQTVIYAAQSPILYKKLNPVQKNVAFNDHENKYVASCLSETQKNDIITGINSLMERDKLFLNSKLTIDVFANKLKTNKKYLSQTINEKYNKNFYSFVNEYRIKEAKKLLNNTEYKNLSIEGIAATVGFNSKSSFNSAFKKITGLTPSSYVIQNLTD